jgi:3-phosphoshikimate 1-carboxyvinyltransferase
LPPQIRLRSPAPLSTEVRPPGSKSLSNRALVFAGMAAGRSQLRGMLDAEDTQVMGDCLRRLGVGLEIDDDVWTVEGRGAELGARETGEAPLFVGTAGTAARFLTAALAADFGAGRPAHVIDGTPRMRERPMATLIHALRDQGARIVTLDREDALPFRIEPSVEALRGGEIVLARPTSSQFVSALVIAATRAARPSRIVLREGTPARPYVDMTLAVLEAFGGRAGWEAENVLRVEPSPLSARDYAIEPDASAASYFLALAAIHGGTATIPDLGRDSLQGDAHFHTVLERMGARAEQSASQTRVTGASLRGVELDLSDMPDMTLTAAVVALFAEGPTTIRGVAVLRHHESDRLAAGATELRKLGAEVDEREDGLRIVPPAKGPRPGITIQTYDDHRMAMAFAMVGDVVIDEPACVGKTFPRYFEELATLGMTVAG